MKRQFYLDTLWPFILDNTIYSEFDFWPDELFTFVRERIYLVFFENISLEDNAIEISSFFSDISPMESKIFLHGTEVLKDCSIQSKILLDLVMWEIHMNFNIY